MNPGFNRPNTMLALLGLLLLSSIVVAEDLPISNTPLFLSTAVAPNVFFEVDDSGSMDWEILTQKHWHFCAYDPRYASAENLILADGTILDCGWLVDNGLWNSYDNYETNERDNQIFETLTASEKNYIYPNNDNASSSNCSNTLESCYSLFSNNLGYQLDWRIFSADFNTLAYDPNVTYQPWQGPCADNGAACEDANFSAPRSDPYKDSDGYGETDTLENFIFEVWEDDRGYSGDRPQRGAEENASLGANGEVDLWDSHKRYTVIGDNINIKTFRYEPDAGNLVAILEDEKTLTGSECYKELFHPDDPSMCRTIAQTKQNIANWYQYHRKRSYVAKNAIAAVVTENPDYRYGLSVINSFDDLFVQVPTGNTPSLIGHNQNMLGRLFSLDWPMEGTPLRLGLQRVGNYFDNTLGNQYADPIIGSCQKNFAVLFTDGYWNGGSPGVGDKDKDKMFNTLADVAKHYYDEDLSPLANEVPTDDFDSQEQQHMVTFTVAFGVEGYLKDTSNPPNGWPNGSADKLAENSNAWWAAAKDEWDTNHDDEDSEFDVNDFTNPAKIDDLWHAAFNSKGTYIAANKASEVVTALQDALQNIQQRTSSAASVALNAGLISDSARIYQASFDSTTWSGELSAVNIDPLSGQVGSTLWQASSSLPHWEVRNILTHNGSAVNNSGTALRWGNLNPEQQDALRQGLSGDDIDTTAMERLDHLRGDRQNEQPVGTLRNRADSVLGDIINSSPAYVGYPAFNYPDSLENTTTDKNYAAFRQRYGEGGSNAREAMVYVGANDGMLHGFSAEDGAERLAYMPRAVFDNISQLTGPDYGHRYYVDGSPTVGDAFFQSDLSWHTVLAGGLNKGGQGIYALEITDPTNLDDSSTVLWEFTDADDDDTDEDMRYALGDTFSRPAIVRLHNGQWAAIFGNGYNNTRADGRASTTGDAVLYIVDIGTGEVIRKINTEKGSAEDPSSYVDSNGNTVQRLRANGLATTAPVDTNGDHIVDYVYAGDLFGNMWKFDLTNSDPAQWDVAFQDASNNPAPLFTACSGTCINGLNDNHQSITTRPEVGRTADRQGLMIYFGTGRYLSSSDTTDTSLQSFYGIADTGSRIESRTALQAQSIVLETSASFGDNITDVRVTSSNGVGGNSGWYLDFESPHNGLEGERIVQTPVLRNNRIIFPTLIPNQDICGFGGSSWLMELNAQNGSRLPTSPFDLNLDGQFTIADYVAVPQGEDSINTPTSGIKHDEILSSPGILNDGDKELKYTAGSSGNISVTVESPAADAFNRQSWRQLR